MNYQILAEQPHNQQGFVVGGAVVYLSAKKPDTFHYIKTVSAKFEYVVLDNADVVNFDSIRHTTEAEEAAGHRINQCTIPGNAEKTDSLGNDTHIENHINPFCICRTLKNMSNEPECLLKGALNNMESCYIEKKQQVELLQTEVARLNSIIERQKSEMIAAQAEIDLLKAAKKTEQAIEREIDAVVCLRDGVIV